MTYKGFTIVELPEFYRVSGGGDGWYEICDIPTLEAAKEYIDKILDN